MGFSVDDFLAGRVNLRIGPKYARTVLRYCDQASDMFEADQQVEAKEWVRAQLLTLAAANDLRWLPDWIETPIEKLIINAAVEIGWELLHSRELRRSLVRAAGAE